MLEGLRPTNNHVFIYYLDPRISQVKFNQKRGAIFQTTQIVLKDLYERHRKTKEKIQAK